MTARLWDLTAEDPASSSRVLVGLDSEVTLLSISRDGHSLVTGARDSSVVRLWDLDAVRLCEPESDYPPGSPLVLPGHQDVVCSTATSLDGRWLVTSSADKTARVWDVAADEPAISPDGHWLATGSNYQTVQLWDLNLESLLDRCRRAAARQLTAEEIKQYLADDAAQERSM